MINKNIAFIAIISSSSLFATPTDELAKINYVRTLMPDKEILAPKSKGSSVLREALGWGTATFITAGLLEFGTLMADDVCQKNEPFTALARLHTSDIKRLGRRFLNIGGAIETGIHGILGNGKTTDELSFKDIKDIVHYGTTTLQKYSPEQLLLINLGVSAAVAVVATTVSAGLSGMGKIVVSPFKAMARRKAINGSITKLLAANQADLPFAANKLLDEYKRNHDEELLMKKLSSLVSQN